MSCRNHRQSSCPASPPSCPLDDAVVGHRKTPSAAAAAAAAAVVTGDAGRGLSAAAGCAPDCCAAARVPGCGGAPFADLAVQTRSWQSIRTLLRYQSHPEILWVTQLASWVAGVDHHEGVVVVVV